MSDSPKGTKADVRERRLARLKLKRKELNSEIRRVQDGQRADARRLATRRRILFGSWVEHQIKIGADGWSEEKVMNQMRKFLKRPHDRAVFGLNPLPAPPEGSEEGTADPEGDGDAAEAETAQTS